MFKSMTGYGRSCSKGESGTFIVEIQSVNRKHLELSLHLPRELTFLDPEIRQLLRSHLQRGHIKLSLSCSYENKTTPVTLRPNLSHSLSLKNGLEEIAKATQLPLDPSSFYQFLLNDSNAFFQEINKENQELLTSTILSTTKDATISLLKSRTLEGIALQRELSLQKEQIHTHFQDLIPFTREVSLKFHDKLLKALTSTLADATSDERILKEIALYAEKVDVTEEISRFQTHLDTLTQLFKSSEFESGKQLDFLLLEMAREINTLSVKSPHQQLTQHTIAIKGALEKMREQTQNLE